MELGKYEREGRGCSLGRWVVSIVSWDETGLGKSSNKIDCSAQKVN